MQGKGIEGKIQTNRQREKKETGQIPDRRLVSWSSIDHSSSSLQCTPCPFGAAHKSYRQNKHAYTCRQEDRACTLGAYLLNVKWREVLMGWFGGEGIFCFPPAGGGIANDWYILPCSWCMTHTHTHNYTKSPAEVVSHIHPIRSGRMRI